TTGMPSSPQYKRENKKWYAWDGEGWKKLTSRSKDPRWNRIDVEAQYNRGHLKEDKKQAPPQVKKDGVVEKGETPLFTRTGKGERNLITVHNLSADNLRHVNELGGLAAPSLAVVRTDKSEFDSFGEISLISNPDILGERKTKTYDADIYTPRHPQGENVIDRKVVKELEDLIFTTPDVLTAKYGNTLGGIEEAPSINRRLSDNDALRYLYLDSIDSLPRGAKNNKDYYDLTKKLRVKIESKKIEAGFERYIRELESKLVTSKRIFKGFTPSGNRKYVPYNLTNIVKEMTRKLQGGEDFMYGAGSVRAQYANKLPSVSSIQKQRNKIIPGAEFSKLKDASNDAFMQILEDLKPYYKFDSDGFGYFDDAAWAIAGGRRGLNETFDMDAEAWKKVNDLVTMLSDMPTEYFEAKVQREMGVSEFSGAAVPRGTSKDVIDILKKAGIKIRYYKKGDAKDRQRAVSGFKNALFTRTDTPSTGKFSVPLVIGKAKQVLKSLNLTNAPQVVVAADETELPAGIRNEIEKKNAQGQVSAVYYEGKVY
ncbi:MAG: hypothetical protein U9R49_15425, partial [Bacteroidota bacterium]|nr:hypothetical protein [Bacteroidota bacterium]